MKIKYLAIILSELFLISLFLVQSAFAQEQGVGFTVTPSNFDLTIERGEVITKTITIENITNKPLAIKVSKRNFIAEGEEGDVSLNNENNSFSMTSWITVKPETATISPKGRQSFTFTVNTPRDAETGGHFGSIVFATIPDLSVSKTGASFSQEVGSLIFTRIPGPIYGDATMLWFGTDKQFYEYGPVTFTSRIKNSTNIHIKPIGSIVITDMLGNKVSVPFDQQNILPHAIRKIPTVLNQHIMIGKYTADAFLSYGTKNQTLLSSTHFYAFPVTYGLITLFILVLFFVLRKRLFRAFKLIATGK